MSTICFQDICTLGPVFSAGSSLLSLFSTSGSISSTCVCLLSDTGSYMWSCPQDTKFVFVQLFGGGGGGAGGSRNCGSIGISPAAGGGGGGGGGYAEQFINASVLPSSVTVSVGLGGAGGAGKSVTCGAGADGTDGGVTCFGTYICAGGGFGGFANGDGGSGGILYGNRGGCSGRNVTPPTGGEPGYPQIIPNTQILFSTANYTFNSYSAPGGGGGGHFTDCSSGTLQTAGGCGGYSYGGNLSGGAGGAAGGFSGSSGSNSVNVLLGVPGSGGGGGGGSSTSNSGGLGGNGGFPGAGGGGGGGVCPLATKGGDGGSGGNGIAIITSFF